MKTNTHIVIKKEDIFKYLTDNQIQHLDAILNIIADGREKDGKKSVNSYYICNTDEPYADKVLEIILKAENEDKKIKLIIDMPYISYESTLKNGALSIMNDNDIYNMIANSIQLPKVHGRMIILSEDAVKRELCTVNFSSQQWISEVGLSNATIAIIEADKVESDEV